MTIIIALSTETPTQKINILASDSRVTKGNSILTNVKNPDKLFKFTNFSIAFTGWSFLSDVLHRLVIRDKRTPIKVKSRGNIKQFKDLLYEEIHKDLSETLSFHEALEEDGKVGEFLLVTSEAIWFLDELNIEEYQDFAAIGSAEDLVLGSLESSFNKDMDLTKATELVYNTMDIAYRRNSACGAPSKVHSFITTKSTGRIKEIIA